jgi:biotin operon repressor
MTQKEQVVRALRGVGALSIRNLERALDIPSASLRRVVQELRADGYNIERVGNVYLLIPERGYAPHSAV